MNCWEILGIDPTHDREAIDRAYEQQKKFAAGEELERLQQAYREASGDPAQPARVEPESSSQELQPSSHEAQPSPEKQVEPEAELTAEDRQVVREAVIQVKALLNDSRRTADDGIWKAILAEPPADQPHIRSAVANELEPQLRPMAGNGSFPSPVVAFLGDWFGWEELHGGHQEHAPAKDSHQKAHEPQEVADEQNTQQQVTNFWPAVVGWIVALGVLAVFFDSIFGG